MSVYLSDCLSLCVPYVCVPGALRGRKREFNALGNVDIGNHSSVLCKSHKQS